VGDGVKLALIIATAALGTQATAAVAKELCPPDYAGLARLLASHTEVKRVWDLGISSRTYASDNKILGRKASSIWSAWISGEPTSLEIILPGDARALHAQFKKSLPGKKVECTADDSGECKWEHPDRWGSAKDKELVEAQIINTFYGPPGTRIRCNYR
jgi:hypothetical protein